MARERKPQLSAEERERNRRLAAERHAEVVAAVERAATIKAQAYLSEVGAMVPGDAVGDRLRRLARYRASWREQVQVAYRPTMRQQQARSLPGIVEIEF